LDKILEEKELVIDIGELGEN